MKRTITTLLAIATLMLTAPAFASTITYTLNGPTGGLEHGSIYSWGINTNNDLTGQTITGARFAFSTLRETTGSSNTLNIDLLGNAAAGFTNLGGNSIAPPADPFSSWASGDKLLNTYTNIPTVANNYTYTFDAAELSSLKTWVADKNFGIGFDPWCNFTFSTMTLSIDTQPVPEPSTLILLGAGIIGAGIIRKKFKKQAF